MLCRKNPGSKWTAWLVLIVLAAVLACLAEREMTMLAGPPFSGYAKVFLIFFAAIFFLLLCAWAVLWLMLQRLQPKPPETSNQAVERTIDSLDS